MTIHRFYAGLSAIIVIIALIWGFLLVGSPARGRNERLDARRIEDLRTIHQTIMDIVYDGRPYDPPTDGTLRRALPESLHTIADQAVGMRVTVTDPDTQEPYAYNVSGETTYELCAHFSTERREPFDIFWNHPKGLTCFSFDATRADGFAGGRALLVPPIVK